MSFASNFLILASILVVANGFSIYAIAKTPDGFREFLPEQVKQFYGGLKDEQKTTLQEIASKNLPEVQADALLKKQDPELYQKVDELKQLIEQKEAALSPEAKEFSNGLYNFAENLKSATNQQEQLAQLKEIAKQVSEKYNSLSEQAKESLLANFPNMGTLIASPKFQSLLKGQ
uniref:Fatty-acid and retinol-binding protein 1 n=1 Tax=Acrobeloides nanus TaxID=290746 RepID=A0A914DD99_9BILA